MTESATSRGSKQLSNVTEAKTSASRLVPISEQDLRIPLSSPAVFWRPRHLAASPMLGWIPFLFWLMETIRPQTVAQFGVGDGVVYMALCQAAERLGGSTACTGFHRDEPLMPPALREQHDTQYSDFSALLRGDPAAGTHSLDGGIDLLVLNQPLDPEALERLQRDWLPRLSDRSVILICDSGAVFPGEEMRRNLFPDMERLILLGPDTAGGHAVETILHGENQPERLRIMAAQRPGKPAYLAARQVFNRLGQGIEATLEACGFQQERETLLTSLQAAETALRARETELSDQQAKVEAARTAEVVEISRLAGMSTRLHDLEQALSRKRGENEALIIGAGTLRGRVEELELLNGSLKTEHAAALEAARTEAAGAQAGLKARIEELAIGKAALEAELADARAAHEARIEDIAVLTRTLEAEHAAAIEAARTEAAGAMAGLKARIEELTSGKTALEAELADARAAHAKERDDLREQIDALAAHRDEILTSTSWRITGPMRGVKNALTRR